MRGICLFLPQRERDPANKPGCETELEVVKSPQDPAHAPRTGRAYSNNASLVSSQSTGIVDDWSGARSCRNTTVLNARRVVEHCRDVVLKLWASSEHGMPN